MTNPGWHAICIIHAYIDTHPAARQGNYSQASISMRTVVANCNGGNMKIWIAFFAMLALLAGPLAQAADDSGKDTATTKTSEQGKQDKKGGAGEEEPDCD